MVAMPVREWSSDMHIVLINPNTTEAMTDRMREAVGSYLTEDIKFTALTSVYGASSIEGYYDEVFAVPPMIEMVTAMKDDIDGLVVGCFDDTGVDALRTVLDVPVVGICQASMQAAAILSNKFSIITTLPVSVPALENLVLKYGFHHICSRVRAADIPVLDLENNCDAAKASISREIEKSLSEDNAEAVVLGCAGMVDLSRELSKEYRIPVIDGVGVAVKLVEALASIGLKTSKRGGYSQPRKKVYSGVLSRYSPAT